MPKIIITKNFEKNLKKNKVLIIDDLILEIKKYSKGLNNFKTLYSPAEYSRLLKGHLNRGKIRVIILLVITEDVFIPVILEKKESKDGYNLSKENSQKLIEDKIASATNDINNKNFLEIKI